MSDIVMTSVPAPASSAAPAIRVETFSPTVTSDVFAAPPVVTPPATLEVKADDPPAPKLGPKFAELAKRQREVTQRELALKERETTLSPLQAAMAEAKSNPLKLLEAAGLTYEEITEFILTDGASLQEEAPEKSVEQIVEEKLAAKAKEQDDAAKATKQQQQIDGFKSKIAEVAAASDAFELVHSLGQQDLVYSVVIDHHAATGQILPIEEALALTESYLEKESRKIMSAKKFSSANPAHQASPEVVPEPQAKTPFTLSRHSAAPTSTTSSERLTREQAADKAASMIRFR